MRLVDIGVTLLRGRVKTQHCGTFVRAQLGKTEKLSAEHLSVNQNVEVISESWIWAQGWWAETLMTSLLLAVLVCQYRDVQQESSCQKVFFNLLMAKYFVMEEDRHLHRTAVNFNRKPTTVWFHMTAEASSVLTAFDFSNSNIRLVDAAKLHSFSQTIFRFCPLPAA